MSQFHSERYKFHMRMADPDQPVCSFSLLSNSAVQSLPLFDSVVKVVTLRMMGKNFSVGYFKIFFSQKIRFDNSCKLSPQDTICMKCQILFSWINKKIIINL